MKSNAMALKIIVLLIISQWTKLQLIILFVLIDAFLSNGGYLQEQKRIADIFSS